MIVLVYFLPNLPPGNPKAKAKIFPGATSLQLSNNTRSHIIKLVLKKTFFEPKMDC